MNNISALSDVAKELAWKEITLPKHCFDTDHQGFCAILDVKVNIVQWLNEEIEKGCWKFKKDLVYDEKEFEASTRVVGILFKRKEDAVYFVTTWC